MTKKVPDLRVSLSRDLFKKFKWLGFPKASREHISVGVALSLPGRAVLIRSAVATQRLPRENSPGEFTREGGGGMVDGRFRYEPPR